MSTDLTTRNQAGVPAIAEAAERSAKEVEGMIVVAQRFPRDMNDVENRIAASCSRLGVAAEAEYQYNKGGTDIAGASIELMRVIAQAYGNIYYGWKENHRDEKRGESHVVASAWDLETNTREVREFVVPHYQDTRNGRRQLGGEREVYEHIANHASRRVRSCLEGVIPKDLVEDARAQCNKTLEKKDETPLNEQIKAMLEAFAKHFKVTAADIGRRFNKSVNALSRREVFQLRKIFKSLKDEMGLVTDFFPPLDEEEETTTPEAPAGSTRTEQIAAATTSPKKKKATQKKKATKRKGTKKKGAEPEPEEAPEPEAEEDVVVEDDAEGGKGLF